MSSSNLGFPAHICLWTRKTAVVLGAALGVLLLCLPLFSQGSYGRILGTVTDQSGGVIAGATVTITDVDRGVSRTLTTDDAGEYNAPNLVPGKYTVRAEAKGFRTVERQNVVLEVGKEPRVDLTLQPGEQTQTVTVTEQLPLVETTNATLGGTLSNTDIVDLPLNGRDYQNLMGLRPGVMLQPGGGPWTQSTNGVRPDESVWMVDGIINESTFDARPIVGMPSPFTDGALILPIDAIQEFNLMENPKAEYGWKPGAVVNVGIKSGTNTLRGAAYAFGRDGSWDARNFFNVPASNGSCAVGLLPACDQTPAQLKQFGGVVGGPIKKDKLFFFAGYEGLRSFIGSAYGLTVPQTGPGAGPGSSMVDAIKALQTALVPVSKVSLALAGCTAGAAPTCSGNLFPNNVSTTSFLSTFPITNTSNNGITKIDYHINSKHTLTGTLFVGYYDSTGEDHGFASQPFTDSSAIHGWSNVESWIWTPNSTVVNELRFGYDRTSFNFVNLDVNVKADGKGYPINTGVTNPLAGGLPNINISGFGAGGAQILGTATNRPQYYTPNPYYDIQDAISYLKGKHALKFGGEFVHLEADGQVFVEGRGLIAFNGGALTQAAFACPPPAIGSCSTSLEDYFAGTPTTGLLLTGNSAVKTTWTSTAGFVQDDWRVTPKVIVNLGLRYEYVSPMKEAHNNFGNFDPNLGMVQQGGAISTVWKGYHKGFEPRVGFAWDVTGKGTTVVRAGASLIHTSWPLTTWLGQFGLQNDGGTSPAAIPTGAKITCGLALNCPATGGGTDTLGVAGFAPGQLCWDPAVPAAGSSCGSGQTTVFPSPIAKCGDGANGAPSPCDLLGVDQNLRSPYVVNYNLSIQHQFGSNFSLEVAYVGNHGYSLLNFHDINQAPLGAGWCLNKPTTAQAADACQAGNPDNTPGTFNLLAVQEARPLYTKFPYLGFINFTTNGSHSRYDSAQVTLTKRMSHGLSFTTGYTYAHGLDNGSLNRFGGLPQDSNNLAAEYASSDFDIRHRATFTVTYNIPGKKGFGQILEGWQLNSIVNLQSAQPWASWDPADNISGTGENADRWNISGNAADFPSGKNSIPFCSGFGTGPGPSCVVTSIYGGVPAPSSVNPGACSKLIGTLTTGGSLGSFGCYVSLNGQSVLVPPALGSFGNMGRSIFRDSGYKNWDFSVFKNFHLTERFGAQFRWEVFNVLNNPIAANPYGASSFVNAGNTLNSGSAGLGFAGLTPDFAAGNPLIGSGSQRVMQLGLKLTF